MIFLFMSHFLMFYCVSYFSCIMNAYMVSMSDINTEKEKSCTV